MSAAPKWQPRFSIEQVRGFSEQQLEQMSMADLSEAQKVASHAGEDALSMMIFSKIPLAPESLMAAKQTMGAEWIRSRNLNTTRADEKYGTGWLDR